MRNRILSDYLLALRTNLKHLRYGEQDKVLAEVEAHIEDRVADLRMAEPDLTVDERYLRATAAFGDPSEIGFSQADGGIVRRSTGDVLLRVAVLAGRGAARTAKATGRGVRSMLKWTGITLLILLAIGLVLVVVAAFVGTHLADTYHDQIVQEIPHPIYSFSGAWPMTQPHADLKMDSFTVPAGAREVHLRFDASPQAGCVLIQLTSPSGKVTALNGNGCSAYGQESTFAETGSWQVQYTFISYVGSVTGSGYYLAAP